MSRSAFSFCLITSLTFTTTAVSPIIFEPIERLACPNDNEIYLNEFRYPRVPYCNFAYSALACFRTGMSGSASSQRVRKA